MGRPKSGAFVDVASSRASLSASQRDGDGGGSIWTRQRHELQWTKRHSATKASRMYSPPSHGGSM